MVTMATAVLCIRKAMVADKNTMCAHEVMRKTLIFLDFARGDEHKRHIRWEAATKHLFSFAF